jgi:hypothetical protein
MGSPVTGGRRWPDHGLIGTLFRVGYAVEGTWKLPP